MSSVDDVELLKVRVFLQHEYPGISEDVLAATMRVVLTAKREEALGGARVRSPYRYGAKVAKRILGSNRRLPGDVSAPPKPVRIARPPEERAAPPDPAKIDVCVHACQLDEDCPTCDHKAPLAFMRSLRRVQLGVKMLDLVDGQVVDLRPARAGVNKTARTVDGPNVTTQTQRPPGPPASKC